MSLISWTCAKIYEPPREEGAEAAEPMITLVGYTADMNEADAELYAWGTGTIGESDLFLVMLSTDALVPQIVAWTNRANMADALEWVCATFPGAMTAQFLPILTREPERGYGNKNCLDTIYGFGDTNDGGESQEGGDHD